MATKPEIAAPVGSNAVATSSTHVDKKDEASTDAHLELLTEHFGFNPKAFIDALVFLANEHLYKIAEQFELVVLQQLKHVEGGDLEAEQGVHAILTLMENALDHTLDTFELYCLRSVFGIRARQARYITLSHHKGLDLRPQSSKAAQNSKQAKSSRKSVVGAEVALTANEKSYQLGETEDSLKRKIAAAKATKHKLLQGKDAAQKSLDKALELADRFSVILAGKDTRIGVTKEDTKPMQPILTETLGHHARKLKADTTPLLKALRELRNTDPLGDPLFAQPKQESMDDGDESGGEGQGATHVRAWQRGREPYLNWEADRIIAKSKRAEAPQDTPAVEVQPSVEETKTPKRKHGGTAPTSSKRQTPGTAHKSRT